MENGCDPPSLTFFDASQKKFAFPWIRWSLGFFLAPTRLLEVWGCW